MPTYTVSSNMGLPIPIVGTTPGPDYASDINSCLTLIDSHDHSLGYGAQITPSGININSDLTFANNDAISLRSVRFTSQTSPLAVADDLGCLYESGVDLYYNDGSGNQVRITQGGNVAGSNGSISGLSSPASASYNSGSTTFVWQSAASTSANMDCGSVIVRNITASSNGVTLSAPVALGSNYTLTFPSALPASQKFASIDSSGNIAANWVVDNSTTAISSNQLIVKSGGITATQLASDAVTTAKILDGNVTAAKLATDSVTTVKIVDANVTRAKLGALGQQTSSSCGTFTTASGSLTDITNLTVTITTTGKPVFVGLIAAGGGGTFAYIGCYDNVSNGVAEAGLAFIRGSTEVASVQVFTQGDADLSGTAQIRVPPGSFWHIDAPGAGTYTYKAQMYLQTGTLALATGVKLIAYEM